MELELQDKVVIVTGASGGIGDAICKSFLTEGSIVVALYRGSPDKLNDLGNWTKNNAGLRGVLHVFPLDLNDPDDVKKGTTELLKKFGRFDVLVNCIGFALERPFLLTDDEEFVSVLNTNLTIIARLTRNVLKSMFIARKGAIVNISSVLGSRYGRGSVVYSAAKAGINRFSQALALEVGQKGIRINTVCPGVIETPMSSNLTNRFGDRLLEMTPLERYGKPEDVAHAVLFLASERTASYITGASIFVDGGISI